MSIIRSLWYKGPLSVYECTCLSSFVRYGHKFILYSYDSVDVPRGVELRDASSVVPESEVFLYQGGSGAGSPSAFSNLFRYELLRRYGDWWCDTDVLCLSDKLPVAELVFAYQDLVSINGAILRMPAGHKLAEELYSEACILGDNISWGEAGPELITRVVKSLGFERCAVDTSQLYPISWQETLNLLSPTKCEEIEQRVSGSSFLHLWNEILRRAPICKQIWPPIGSYMHKKISECGFQNPIQLTYRAEDIDRFISNQNRDLDLLSRLNVAKAQYDTVQQERDAARFQCKRLREDIELLKKTAPNAPKSWSLWPRWIFENWQN